MFPILAGTTAQGTPVEIRIFEEPHADELFLLIEANRKGLREWLPWLDLSRVPSDTLNHIRFSQEQYEAARPQPTHYTLTPLP